ncbi:MAG: HAMP domain-containing sensor histidine kinase [Pseudoxanthomonas sp.]
MERILTCWDEYAQTMSPAADEMSLHALRDHSEAMLRAVALDIDSPQSKREQREKSLGESDEDGSSAASEHGHLRHASNFTLIQLSSEFRALRASVLRLWLKHVETVTPDVLDDVIRFNEAIDQALAESIVTYAARAEHSRDLFDAILGHDLRGPLSAMSLSGELLTRGGMPAAKAVEMGARVTSSARYMASMVDDMLEFARTRLGSAPMPLHLRPASIESICSGAISDAAAMHPRSRFEMQLEGGPEASIDADRVRRLLMNLLGNAGQHGTPDRPVILHAQAGESETIFRVINEGRDIPSGHLRNIFEPLVRLNSEKEDDGIRTTSLGLGLHIARQIAAAHGGSITAESAKGQTTFTVRLPVRLPEPATAG